MTQPPDEIADEIARLRQELADEIDILDGIRYCFDGHVDWARKRANEIADEMEQWLGHID